MAKRLETCLTNFQYQKVAKPAFDATFVPRTPIILRKNKEYLLSMAVLGHFQVEDAIVLTWRANMKWCP